MKDNKKIYQISHKIAEFIYKVMKKRIVRGLGELSTNDHLNLLESTALIVLSLSNLNVAMLKTAKDLFEKCEGNQEEFNELLILYFEHTLHSLGKYGDEVRSNIIKNTKH